MGYAPVCELDKNMDGITRFHRFRYHLGSGFVIPSDNVIDLGCGTAYGTKILASKAGQVFGFDKEESNIDYANRHHFMSNAVFTLADVEEIETFEADVVCAFEVFEHLYQPDKVAVKLKQGIKKYIVASVPLDQKLVYIDGDPQEEGDSTHHSVFTKDSFMSMFLDETWKEFWSFRDGVTLIAVFYNNENVA